MVDSQTSSATSKFIVVLDRPDVESWNTIQRLWPENHYIHTQNVAYLKLPASTLTAEIASHLGMNGERKVSGIVIRVGNYYGLNDLKLWEWLKTPDG